MLIPTPAVFSYYSRLAFNPRYRQLFCEAALTEFGVCSILPVLHTAYCGVSSLLGKPIALSIVRLTLLLLPPAIREVIRRLNALSFVHGAKYDAAHSSLAFDQQTCIYWTALAIADSNSKLWICHNLETGVASARLLVPASYCTQPSFNVLAASRLAHDYLWSNRLPD